MGSDWQRVFTIFWKVFSLIALRFQKHPDRTGNLRFNDFSPYLLSSKTLKNAKSPTRLSRTSFDPIFGNHPSFPRSYFFTLSLNIWLKSAVSLAPARELFPSR